MSTARALRTLKLVLSIALYFALATVALTDPPKPSPAKPKPPRPTIVGKNDPGDDDDKMSGGELAALTRKKKVAVDASRSMKANSNAEVRLPSKTSQKVQEIKLNETKSKKRGPISGGVVHGKPRSLPAPPYPAAAKAVGSGDSKPSPGDTDKHKKSH